MVVDVDVSVELFDVEVVNEVVKLLSLEAAAETSKSC